mmetsp:Transcript_16167/g.39088  ORF Transcript_16167/g.39088 Transcript_16167/m.39088 type:complete len:308 (+) Transcript_16167:85-1008(+)
MLASWGAPALQHSPPGHRPEFPARTSHAPTPASTHHSHRRTAAATAPHSTKKTRKPSQFPPLVPGVHHIVDLQDHTHGLRSHLHGRHRDQQGLHHVLIQDVGDCSLPHVDAKVLFSVGVVRPQLGDDVDRVQPRVLGQSERDDLESLRVLPDDDALVPLQGARPGSQLHGKLHLRSPPSGDHRPLLHKGAHHAQGVVDGPLRLLQHHAVGTPNQDRHSRVLQILLQPREADDGPQPGPQVLLGHQVRGPQLLLGEALQDGHRLAAQHARHKVNLVPLHVPDNQNLRLSAEIQGQIGDRVPQDRLLDQ